MERKNDSLISGTSGIAKLGIECHTLKALAKLLEVADLG